MFNPPKNREKKLDPNIDSHNLNFPDLQKAPKTNLSKLEWMVIHDLKYEKNIEIETTGKGRSVVTLSKSHYKCIILSHINPDQAIIKKNKSFNNKV